MTCSDFVNSDIHRSFQTYCFSYFIIEMASLHVFSSYHIHYKIPQLEIGGCYQNSIRSLEFLLYFLQFPNSLRLTKGWLFWHTAGVLLILILLLTVDFLARMMSAEVNIKEI